MLIHTQIYHHLPRTATYYRPPMTLPTIRYSLDEASTTTQEGEWVYKGTVGGEGGIEARRPVPPPELQS